MTSAGAKKAKLMGDFYRISFGEFFLNFTCLEINNGTFHVIFWKNSVGAIQLNGLK